MENLLHNVLIKNTAFINLIGYHMFLTMKIFDLFLHPHAYCPILYSSAFRNRTGSRGNILSHISILAFSVHFSVNGKVFGINCSSVLVAFYSDNVFSRENKSIFFKIKRRLDIV